MASDEIPTLPPRAADEAEVTELVSDGGGGFESAELVYRQAGVVIDLTRPERTHANRFMAVTGRMPTREEREEAGGVTELRSTLAPA